MQESCINAGNLLLKCRKVCLNAGVTVYPGSKRGKSEIFSIVDAISDQKGTTIMTSWETLELTLVFTIVDAISGWKGTTIATNHNICNKKVRQGSRKSGKISGKNPAETEGKTWKTSRTSRPKCYIIYKRKEPKGQGSVKSLWPRKLVT